MLTEHTALTALSAAELVGTKIATRSWSTNVKLKAHATFGTTSVSKTDREAEALIIEKLRAQFPSALFVGEESEMKSDAQKAFYVPLTFFIDPRDGTTEDSHELPLWCVSIGIMEWGILTGGVVFAPDVRGGLVIASESNGGVEIAERKSFVLRPIEEVVRVAAGAKPVVHIGVDVQRLDTYHRFLATLPKELRPRGIAPSGALSLALVAAGRVDAIVQSPQMPWDFAASMAMVLKRRDLSVHAFRIEDNKVVGVELYDSKNFRTDQQAMGFVVGKGTLAHPLYDHLFKSYGAG